MGFSRANFAIITDNMRYETLEQRHHLAFEYFQGIPQQVQDDNRNPTDHKPIAKSNEWFAMSGITFIAR